jgi:hypothetical protein
MPTARHVLTQKFSIEYHRPISTQQTVFSTAKISDISSNKECVVIDKMYNAKAELCVSYTGHYRFLKIPQALRLKIIFPDLATAMQDFFKRE